jgi:hypothetical protein
MHAHEPSRRFRIASPGSTSCQSDASRGSRSSANMITRSSSIPSRSRRARAETHSTTDPHQTSMAESSAASDCSRPLDSSRTSNGTIAEESQNLTGPLGAPQGGLPRPRRCFWAAAAARSRMLVARRHDPAAPCRRGQVAPGARPVRSCCRFPRLHASCCARPASRLRSRARPATGWCAVDRIGAPAQILGHAAARVHIP